MMSDHGDFSCLQFPKEWGHPRFNLGDRVWRGKKPVIVMGLSYVHPSSVDGREGDKVGWWMWVADLEHHWKGCEFGECLGIHEEHLEPGNSVIHPLPDSVGRVLQHQHPCITAPTPLHPLNGWV